MLNSKAVVYLFSLCLGVFSVHATADPDCPELLQYQHQKLRSDQQIDFCEAYNDKVLLVINTASQCGYTSQFSGLQTLYEQYRDQGLVLLGFPSDDFRQEYSNEADIAKVCYVNYGVSFPMLSESSVTGRSANGFFQAMQQQGAPEPTWNFNKFLIDRSGNFIAHYPSAITPEDTGMREEIERLLDKR